jgi:hypothetical protein
MVSITPQGGRGTGVNPEGTDYPFVNPQDDVRGILADAFLAHEVAEVQLPLRLTKMTNFDAGLPGTGCSLSTDRPDVVIKDATGRVICDTSFVSAAGYRETDFGTRLRIHEWTLTDDVQFENKAFICRIVQHTDFGEAEDVYCIEHTIYPENAELDERVSQLLPKRVRSITVNTTKFKENIGITTGYNLGLFEGDDVRTDTVNAAPTVAVPGAAFPFPSAAILRPHSRITLSAAPGDGLGRYPGCVDDDRILRRINGVEPQGDVDDNGNPLINSGNFLVHADSCYYARPPITLPGPTRTASTLKIGNDCGTCCECVEFSNTYKALANLAGTYKNLGVSAEATRDLHKANQLRWTAEKDCRARHPLRLAVADRVDASGTTTIAVTGSICNMTDECRYNIVLKLCFICGVDASGVQQSIESSCWGVLPSASMTSDGRIGFTMDQPDACNTTISSNASIHRQPYTPKGSADGLTDAEFPCYYYLWTQLDPGRSINFRTTVTFDCAELVCACDPMRIVLSASVNGAWHEDSLEVINYASCEVC